MKVWISVVFVCVASIVSAQTATPTSKITWDQQAPTLEEAQGYTFTYYPDGATTGIALAGVTCTGTAAPFVCQVTYPAFTPGPHSLQLTAGNQAGESPKSAVFSFTFAVVPATPTNIR